MKHMVEINNTIFTLSLWSRCVVIVNVGSLVCFN